MRPVSIQKEQAAMKNRLVKMTLGLGACLAGAYAVFAIVTFDPASGKGFVGKGDVQLAMGWNNAQLQANAHSVAFNYVVREVYAVTEVFATGNPDNPWSLNVHEIAITMVYGIRSSVDADPRQVRGQKQFTGFNLFGYTGVSVSGSLPEPDYIDWVTYTWTDKKGVTHTTEGMPVDENGVLYTQGDNRAVLSVDQISSSTSLLVNGVPLP
jgi:hypothetical protein